MQLKKVFWAKKREGEHNNPKEPQPRDIPDAVANQSTSPYILKYRKLQCMSDDVAFSKSWDRPR